MRLPVKLNNHSYLHVQVRKEVSDLCNMLNKELNESFKCLNLEDNLYGFLLFKSNSYVIVFCPGIYYVLSNYNKYFELSSEVVHLSDVIMNDLLFLSMDLST